MSPKSSIPQDAKSVTLALTPNSKARSSGVGERRVGWANWAMPLRSSKAAKFGDKSAALVAPHQAGVADDVRSNDRRQFALLTG
jgi:hypothetical protein